MVSVIIPTYNRAGTLFNAAKSVLNQTYKDLELLIVDDGSTDNTEEVVNSLDDKRVRYIKLSENKGACVARNRGIEEANGEFIAFQDSDDLWRSTKLEEQLLFLQQEKADMVFCAIDRYSVDSNIPRKFPYTDPSNKKTKNEMFDDLLLENTVSMVTVVCKSECARENKFDMRLPRRQDWDWALRVAQQKEIRYLNKVLVDSYAQYDSISYSTSKHVEALKIIYDKYMNEINIRPKVQKQWKVRMANALFDAGIPAMRECWKAFMVTGNMKLFVKSVICGCGLQKVFLLRTRR